MQLSGADSDNITSSVFTKQELNWGPKGPESRSWKSCCRAGCWARAGWSLCKMLCSFFLDAGFLMFGQVYGVKVTRLSWMVFLTFPDYFGKYLLLQEKSREDFMGNAIPTASWICGSDFQGGDISGDGRKASSTQEGVRSGGVWRRRRQEAWSCLCLPLSLQLRPPTPALLSPAFIVLISVPLTAGYCTSQCDQRIFLALSSVCLTREGERVQDITDRYFLPCCPL